MAVDLLHALTLGVEFADKLPRDGLAIDYAALDDLYGGGGYPTSVRR